MIKGSMYIDLSLGCLEMTCHIHNVSGFSGRRRITDPDPYHILDVVLFSLLMEQKEIGDDSSPDA